MAHRLLLPMAFAVLVLGACEETPTETVLDVSAAQQEVSRDLVSARADATAEKAAASRILAEAKREHGSSAGSSQNELARAEALAMIKTAEADYVVTLAEADGVYGVALEKCDALDGADGDVCMSRALADLTNLKALALVRKDERLAQAEQLASE